MIRITTAHTLRALRQEAARVPGLDADLTGTSQLLGAVRAELAALTERYAQLDQDRRDAWHDVEELRDIYNEVVQHIIDVITGPDREQFPRRVAMVLVRFSAALGLSNVLRLPADLAGAEAADPEPEGPRTVTLYLRFGRIRAVHATRDGAQEAAEADGALVGGWIEDQVDTLASSTPVPYTVAPMDVQGEWPDHGTVWLLMDLDDVVHAVHGTATSAGEAAMETYTATGHERHIRPWPVSGSPMPASAAAGLL